MTIRSVSLSVFILSILFLASSAAPGLQATAAGDDASLRAYIQAANNGAASSITLTGDLTLSAALPQIRGNIIINGGGHSISGAGEYRIFDVNGGTLTLTNVTLTEGNGGAAYGGAIRLLNGAEVTIDGSTLSDNKATHGGAIAASGSSVRLSVKDSSFIGNIAEKSAGAIYANGGTVSVTNSNFVKNCALFAFYALMEGVNSERFWVDDAGCHRVRYVRSEIDAELQTHVDGGAIRLMNGAQVSIEHSSFSENSATYGGGVSTASKNVRLSVTGSSFVGNRASWSGGAIGASWTGGGRISVSNSSFVENSSQEGDGGAIETTYSKLDIVNSTFSENEAGGDGGAVKINESAEVTIAHATFVDNWSDEHQANAISKTGGKAYLRNSIVIGNLSDEICGNLKQNIGNLIKDGSCSPMLSGDPMLEEATDTSVYLELLPGSPAINAADARFCPDTDQLGRARSIVGRCDIGAIEAIPISQALSDCRVTTTHLLNLRDGPGGKIIGGVLQNATLRVMARTPRWFEVEHEGRSGWISADYVVAEGDCG